MRFSFISPLTVILCIGGCFSGCRQPADLPEVRSGDFIIRDFNPIANWTIDSSGRENTNPDMDKTIFLDYTDAIETGFVIPSPRQTEDGMFRMEFSIRNTGDTPARYIYKIYYQNESYKFPERDVTDTTRQHIYAGENFYGSWEDVSRTFTETEPIEPDGKFHKITDHFRITGNPRDEHRYYSNQWNERWKRNPRTGAYSFLLVVTIPGDSGAGRIPEYIAGIGQMKDSAFVNPYYYFLYGEGSRSSNTVVTLFPYRLKVIARPDLGAGIYINSYFFPKDKFGQFFTDHCSNDPEQFKQSPVEQFIHYIDPETKYSNIPVIADVTGGRYTKLDYNWNRQFYRKEEMVSITASTTKRPCETVKSDPEKHLITITNPGTRFGEWEKQNVGIITRHGFTYGKWTVKAKLTELLNRFNMWNGLTNAVWLITQDQGEWNFRRPCYSEGYMASYYGGYQDKRVRQVGYSEIDFEILKTVPYCPAYIMSPAYYHGIIDPYHLEKWNIPLPEDLMEEDDMIQVACTNWDMACPDPAGYASGCSPVQYDSLVFWAHRWDRNYRAITEKTPEKDDELFAGPYYYFQIDWQPERIIWRIGPSKDKLRVVGYVDNTVTCIPNNQMLLIVSQEFHNTKWWIGSMYSQDNIPFPEEDITGEIYEVTIE
jgi:hypothetical protein